VRFLLSRRWLAFFLAVALAAWGAWALGQWQFHRLHDRKAENRLVAHNLAAAPVPLDVLMRVGQEPDDRDEWRRVTVHGTWDDDHAVVLKYQTRDGAAGIDVVTPLRTAGGPAVLVDRGWLATENSGGARPAVPDAGDGPVTVTGYVRQSATGGATRVGDMSTRAISSSAIARELPYPVYGGFVDLADQAPAAAKPLGAVELPDDTSNGPHFFYGLQWWFFGALAIFGFFFLMYDEFQRRKEGQVPGRGRPSGQSARTMPPSTGTIAPVTNDEAGLSRNAATRPNSSGSP
jgi:cytochrome oxidase assembly protein ShyY1